ncbi:MAG: zf-TFIIB domain-containing protein [Luteolibacter sp.]
MNAKPQSLVCPRDGGAMIPMERKSLSVSHCGGCHGMWIPKTQIVGRVEGNLIRKLYHAPAKRMAELRCPTDGSPLWEFCAGGVLLDRCNSCGGLWFDAGELETVMGKICFTTSPSIALSHGEDRGSTLDTLGRLLTPPPSTGAEVAVELLIEIVKWAASSLE